MKRHRPTSARKRPSQARSQATVDTILDAAAQVFEARGYAAGTTNRIAVRAGVSIGSVYEYFPNKDAIVVALANRELERERQEIMEVLADSPRKSLNALLRQFVETIVAFHARSPALHRILFDEAEHPPETHACVLRFEESLAHALEAVLRKRRIVAPDRDLAAHLVVQTTESLAHRFVLRGIHELDQHAFIEEVTRLLARYLGTNSRRRAPS
ncbi:MAG: TetR/AcrR family transcriptional regulator [bacterium]|nr:TetR/AcrR family transcriptional regulator [bacterium]MCP5071380.1 TetR/AcrR family transcriptional regulator [bacterium]